VSTCAKIAQVQNEGGREVRRDIDFYNLDMSPSISLHITVISPNSVKLKFGLLSRSHNNRYSSVSFLESQLEITIRPLSSKAAAKSVKLVYSYRNISFW